MIEINELRIANLFHDEDKTPCYFAGAWERGDGWIIRDSAGNTYKPMQIYPIPLTPELLEACGFVSFKTNREATLNISHDESDSLSLTCYDKKADELSISIEKTGRDDDWNSQYTSTITPVRYLHQLQNLYFALTGTELEVNLPTLHARDIHPFMP